MVLRLLSRTLIMNNLTKQVSHGCIPGKSFLEVVEQLEKFAPLNLSEKWDNTGVLLEPSKPRQITKILLTNDLTEDVMDEAVNLDTELIISYHPPIFTGLKRITQKNWKERIVTRCLESKIAIYSPHTSWDSVSGGVNDWLAKCLPQHERKFIVEGITPNSGQGRFCELNAAISLNDLLNSVKTHIGSDTVMMALAQERSLSSKVQSVALCAGSGASVLRGVNADVFLTGEMSHHEVLDAVHNGTSVILTNHSNSERGFLKEFSKVLEEKLLLKIFISEKDSDPIKFY